MIVDVHGHAAHAATGGVPLADKGPVLLLVHGAGMDGTVWQQQIRFLAHRGIRPLAVDLPGHGRSSGEPLRTISDMATWLNAFIGAAGLDQPVHVAGHSMGTFVALQLAANHPNQVSSMVLLGTAESMPVHPELVTTAGTDLPAAAALMAAWSFDRPAHLGLNPTPGMWMLGGARALVENGRPGALSADFEAVMAYQPSTVAATVSCPVTIVIGLGDKMTTPASARALAQTLTNPKLIELAGTGHMMMLENPRAVRSILKETVS